MAIDLAAKPAPGLIFDLDGVLVDTVPAHMAAWARMFSEFGYSFSQDIYERRIDGRPRMEALRSIMTDAPDERLERAATVKNAYFLANIGRGLYNRFYSSERFVNRWRVNGARLAVASSSHNVHFILKTVGLIDCFDVVVGGGDVPFGKPRPDIFLKAASMIGLSPEACIVFEDAEVGVEAAKSGGFRCIGVHRYGSPARLARADAIVSSLDEAADDLVTALATAG